MVQARGIVKVLPVLKSTAKNDQHKKGQVAEQSVVRLLQNKNWVLCFHGLRTVVAEIDLIFIKKNQVLLIEVKTLDNSWRAFDRIHQNQLMKLQYNLVMFTRKINEIKFRAFVAWVDKENKISFTEIGI